MCIYIFPMPWVLSQWELVTHILLKIAAKIMNAAAKTALPFYLVMSIFLNKCCLLSCGLFFCHLLCVLTNRIDITEYQKYASDNTGPPSKKKKRNASGCVWECKIFLWFYNFKLNCLCESPLTEWRALWKALQLGQLIKYLMEHTWKEIGQR